MKQLSNMIKIIIFLILFQNFLFNPNNTTLSYEDFGSELDNEKNITERDYSKTPSDFVVSYLAYIIESFIPGVLSKFQKFENLNQTCFKQYLDNYNDTLNLSEIKQVIKYSGKSYPDFGDEKSCIDKENAFILFNIKFNVEEREDYDGSFKLLPFISSGYAFYGLCIDNITECTDSLPFSIVNVLSNYNSTVYRFSKIYNVSFYVNRNNHTEQHYSGTKGSICLAVNIILFIYIILRIIITFVGLKYFKNNEKNQNNKYDEDSNSSSSSEESEEENAENSINDKNQKSENLLTQSMSKNDIIDDTNIKTNTRFYFIYKISSIGIALDNIVKNKGKLYNESDLHLIYFLRGCSLLLKTFNINLFSVVFMPSSEINNTNFFMGKIMIFAKMSSFADVLFILCEGIILGYKLMSFIRKYNKKNENPSFKLFIDFFKKFIPCFSTVFSIFIILYYFSDDYLHFMLGEKDYIRTRMQFFRNNIFNCRNCMSNTTEIFYELIPFYMQYHSFYKNQIDMFECCFQFMIVFTNIFYCFFIILLLTFISFKLKKILYDYFLLILQIVNIILSIYLLNDYFSIPNQDYFNVKILFGEYSTIRFTHLFINYYTIGFFVGLAIFYNNDLTHDNSMDKSSIYKPFSFCAKLIRFFYLKPIWFNVLLTILLLLIYILLFSSFWILVVSHSQANYFSRLTFNINKTYNYLYLYEKSIFAVCSGFLIIISYSFKKDFSLNTIFNNRIFSLLNRVGYGYYAIIELIIYLLYCYGELEVQLNSLNIFYITCGVIFVLTGISIYNIILFEVPWRIICKKSLKLKSADIEINNI